MLSLLQTVILFITMALVGCEEKINQPANPKPQANTYAVTKQAFDQSIEQIATGSPIPQDKLTAPIEGYIVSQLIPYGSTVKKGDIIFYMVDEDAPNQIFNALGSYLSAQIDLQDAENAFNDNKLEFEAGLVSQESFNLKEMDLIKSKTAFLEAKYKLVMICKAHNLDFEAVTKINQDNFESFLDFGGFSNQIAVRAPQSGILIPVALNPDKGMSSSASAGTKADSGQSIAALSDLHLSTTSIFVNETQLALLEKKPAISVISPADPKSKFSANIEHIDLFNFNPKADEQTRYPVTIRITGVKNIKPGTRFKIIIHDQPHQSILIPINAVHEIYKKPYVIMKNQEKRFVQLGHTNQNMVEVTAGLVEKDVILIPTKANKP